VLNVGWRNLLYGDSATEAARARARPVVLDANGVPFPETNDSGALARFDGVVRAHQDKGFSFGALFEQGSVENSSNSADSASSEKKPIPSFSFGFELAEDPNAHAQIQAKVHAQSTGKYSSQN